MFGYVTVVYNLNTQTAKYKTANKSAFPESDNDMYVGIITTQT